MTARDASHSYKLCWIIGPTYRDDPEIEFPTAALLIAHINAAYPDHTQYQMIVTRITKS